MQWQYITDCFHTFILVIKRLSLMPSMDIKLKRTRFDLLQWLLFPLLDQMCHGVGLRLLGAAGFPPGAADFVRTDESRPEWHLRADSCTFSQTSTSVPPEPHGMPWTPTNTTSTKQNIQTTRWQYNDILKEMQLLYITIYIRHQGFSAVALEVNFPWTLIKHTWTSSSRFLGLLESYRQLSLIRVWEKDCWKVDLGPDFRSPVLYITAKVYMRNSMVSY